MDLTPIFVLMTVGSFSLLFIMTVFDGLGDMLDEGFDALLSVFDLDVDGGDGTRWISSMSLTAFVGFAGAGGFISQQLLEVTNGPSVVFALLSGLMGGGLVALFMSWMRKQERSTHLQSGALVGKEATVTISIPENGIGEVRFVGDESHRFAARSTDGSSIPHGTAVVIEKEGQPIIVRRKR